MSIDPDRKKQIAFEIVKSLSSRGHTAFYAGGCVRDLILGIASHDYDIATSATPDEIERLFPKTIPVGKQFGVILALVEGAQFEVATFRKEGGYADGRHPGWVEAGKPEEDAQRRDFTVNGLFYDPIQRKVIDFVGGEKDIKAGIIRAIGDPEERFREDKLRLIRAVRFASTLGFEIEPKTFLAVKKMSQEILSVSKERIRDELIKIFTRKNPGRGMILLSESGLMKAVLPEIEAMKGCEQQPEYHPEGDVFIHTKLLLDKLHEPSVTMAFSALLHDVGKPPTYKKEDGKIHFYEHDRVGAEMTREIMERLRFSNKEIDAVAAAVGNHMKFMNVQVMREGKLKNFLGRDTFPEELELHKIDCQSSHGMLDNYEFLKSKIQQYKEEELKPKPLLNGNDLMAAGVKPGPAMGEILRELYDQQLEGVFKTKEDALQWALTKAKERKAQP